MVLANPTTYKRGPITLGRAPSRISCFGWKHSSSKASITLSNSWAPPFPKYCVLLCSHTPQWSKHTWSTCAPLKCRQMSSNVGSSFEATLYAYILDLQRQTPSIACVVRALSAQGRECAEAQWAVPQVWDRAREGAPLLRTPTGIYSSCVCVSVCVCECVCLLLVTWALHNNTLQLQVYCLITLVYEGNVEAYRTAQATKYFWYITAQCKHSLF